MLVSVHALQLQFLQATSQLYCRVSEREGWFGSNCKKFGDASKFRTIELSCLSQDDSESLEAVAGVLADIVGCQPEDISEDTRRKVLLYSRNQD